MLTPPLAQGSHGSQGTHICGHTGACSTHMGALIIGWAIIGCIIGAATGVAIGVPIASGAPSTAGAIVVPHGEPLWNQFRQRPMQHRVQPLLAVTANSANRIVNFLMIGSPRLAKALKGGRGAVPREADKAVGRANLQHGG
jgi:hypothetical protein